jgi:molecular chaperone GrpE
MEDNGKEIWEEGMEDAQTATDSAAYAKESGDMDSDAAWNDQTESEADTIESDELVMESSGGDEEELSGETETEGMDAKEAKSWAERKAAKRQAKQDKKADGTKEKIEQLEDRVKRQMAEFENFRKRTEREKSAMFEIGAKSVIEKILPTIDNFERGLASVPEAQKEDAFVEGMNKVYRQMMTELQNLGVKVIDTVGCEFNPVYHNAVMQVESEEYEPGTIAQELQKGYTYRDSVVRHSMVAVVSE